MRRKFSHLVAVREQACLQRIESQGKVEDPKFVAKDRAELTMWERYHRD